jgi:hypothetical protein
MTDYTQNQFAYDVASQSLVKIADPDTGTIAEQKQAMRDLITKSTGNQVCGFEPSTPTLDVVYVGVDDGEKEYRMPETRIRTDEGLIERVKQATQRVGIASDVDDGLRVDATLDEF